MNKTILLIKTIDRMKIKMEIGKSQRKVTPNGKQDVQHPGSGVHPCTISVVRPIRSFILAIDGSKFAL